MRIFEGSPRVLIVEDEAIIAMSLADSFEEAGAEVLGPAASVREALSLLDRDEPDAALLDVNLLDGEVTPVALRLLAQGVPILIYTGRGPPAALAVHEPAVPVIIKPARTEILCRTLDRLIRAAASAAVQSG
jgi:DNA-binding response OmpR family regulator